MIDSILALALMALSATLYIVGWIILIWGYNWLKKNNHSKTSFTKRGVWFAILLLVATTISRYVAGRTGYLEQGLLPWPEELVNSFMHALQSFTLDESYTDYLVKGAEGVEALWPHTGFSTVNSIYTTILNISCAITSQVALVAVIARVFPRVKLFLVSLRFWKPICYFSELNPESISLAKSIRYGDRKEKKALFVFCSADSDDDNISSECIEQARELGATLTRISLGDLKLTRRIGKKTFFLMGKDDDNLAILSGFAEEERVARLKENDAIYVFANDNYGTLIEKTVRDKINRTLNGLPEKELLEPDKLKKKGTLFCVNRYKNLVYNLLGEEPLFTALNEESKDLKIAIFGSGKIGTEMFLAAYWCGQMIDRKLKITVVSVEKESHFRSRIDHINSDILKTCDPNPEEELLKINGKGALAESYCSFEFVNDNVYLDGLDMLLAPPEEKNNTPGHINGNLVDFDYFVIALGSDKRNMEVAEQIRRIVTVKSRVKRDAGAKVPIACAVWSNELNDTIGETENTGSMKAEIIPFGSMESSFNIDRVSLDAIREQASSTHDTYERIVFNQKNNKKKYEQDPYAYWANVSRAIHLKYKAKCVSMNIDEYLSEAKSGSDFNNKRHELAWLEHRRWCAFMRTEGFRCPTADEELAYINMLPDDANDTGKNKGMHKNIELKLHPCIVECDKIGIRPNLFTSLDKSDDMLDCASRRFKNKYLEKCLHTYDFKMYDYPEFE